MDLSRIAIEPRLREGWEAVDMGVAMVRAWWWPLQLSWLAPSACLFVILFFTFSDFTWLAFLITWWLNPLWDRFPLLLASRALFDEPLRVGSVWRQWWSLFKTDWFAWLTWRRFSPTRAMDMSVTVLEQLHGDVRTRRLNVLHRNTSGVAFLCTLLCLLFELLVVGALWVLVILLIPSDYWLDQLFSGFSELFWLSKWSVVIWYLAVAMVSPFYVVSGFALYINRRIELEGWDIEIRFRHLVQRVEDAKTKTFGTKKIASVILALVICGGALTEIPKAIAQATPEQALQSLNDSDQANVESESSAEAKAAKDAIVEVLNGEDFHRTEIDKGWRFKKKTDEETGEENYWFMDLLADFFDFVEPFFTFIANLFKVVPFLVWIGLALLVAAGIYYFRDALASIGRRSRNTTVSATPDVLFGLDLRKESLPENVPDEVAQLWRAGKHREAVGLLYRATLSGLIYQFAFEFYDGYTELECAAIVRNKEEGALSIYVQRLTSAWQSIAYAHRLPTDNQITELCSEWPDYFGQGGASAE